MSKNGKFINLINRLFAIRSSEILLATGIPLIAFFSSINQLSAINRLLWLYPLLIIAGWHVIAVNDLLFDKSVSKKEKLFKFKIFIPVILVPLAVICLIPSIPSVSISLLLIMLNWDLYSAFGKNYWHTGLFHNFLGGFLHFCAGAYGGGNVQNPHLWAMGLFLALAMSSGAMHHDAIDFQEDSQQLYITGAVRFGADRWWRLAPIPLLLAQVLFCFTPILFSLCFGISSMFYLCVYLIAAFGEKPSCRSWFRFVCRLIFACGSVIYIFFHLTRLSP